MKFLAKVSLSFQSQRNKKLNGTNQTLILKKVWKDWLNSSKIIMAHWIRKILPTIFGII
jgi:hypothetical protein